MKKKPKSAMRGYVDPGQQRFMDAVEQVKCSRCKVYAAKALSFSVLGTGWLCQLCWEKEIYTEFGG